MCQFFWRYGLLGNTFAWLIFVILSYQIHRFFPMESLYPSPLETFAKAGAGLLPLAYSLYTLRSIWRRAKTEESRLLKYIFISVALFFFLMSAAIYGFLVKEIIAPSLPHYMTDVCTDYPCL